MIDGAQAWMEKVRRTVLAALRGQNVRVFLFGSRARGDHSPASDVDIGILPADPTLPLRLAPLRVQLEEMPIPYVIELVNLVEVSPAFREKVLQEGILWQN
ncbi:MAG: nucleotidyltransferase domain-containing protein [Coprothermobacterota bacterium]|nr:nucleotidyltransferase domain-containing protein [Coprothermobacterota bacterium]